MNRKIWIFMAALLTAAPAHAGFISSYDEWQKMSPEKQRGYVLGWFDENMAVQSELKWTKIRSDAVLDCARAVGLNSSLLVTAVNDAYKANPTRRGQSPITIAAGVVHHMCLDRINQAREKAGLEAWLPWPNWK